MIENAEDLIRELNYVTKKYENEKLFTFEVSRKRMAEDCIKIVTELLEENKELKNRITFLETQANIDFTQIEELQKQIEKMKSCRNCKFKFLMLEDFPCSECENNKLHDKWELEE